MSQSTNKRKSCQPNGQHKENMGKAQDAMNIKSSNIMHIKSYAWVKGLKAFWVNQGK